MSVEKTVFKQRLSEVESIQGSGTSMVSLYIPADKNISAEKARMSQEKSEASNIKSKSNRKNVQKSIGRVNDILKQYRETPKNGIVIFVGITEDGTKEFVFDNLPQELEYSNYTCDNKFHTQPLREMISPDRRIGLLIVERGGSIIGELRGTRIKVHEFDEESYVRSKHNAGGFSNRRFDRLIEEEKDDYFKKVSETLKEEFIGSDNRATVDGFVIGGTIFTAKEFANDFLPEPLKNVKIGGEYSIDIANPEGLENLVDKARDQIESVDEQEQREYAGQFFASVGGNNQDEHATYGETQVETALEYGAVESVLVSENLSNEKIKEFKEKAEQQGGEVVLISDDFSEGEQFWRGFDGLGAILRYPIS